MAPTSTARRLGRLAVALVVALLAAAVGWALFVRLPGGNLARLLGVLVAVALTLLGLRAGSSLGERAFASYNVAEVAVEGPITRQATRTIPGGPITPTADDVVDQIATADEDPAASALLLRLNTPGGEVVPSDDIRRAAEEFDGPTVAYATDTCASGGYWIASGCDRIFARDGSLVGSIGVIGSRPNLRGLADRLGVSYEQLTAGEYKDAGNPLKEFTDRDREYLQGIVDDYYDAFVERVAEGRDIDEEAVRDTEARVYVGADAREAGLVDELGDRDDVTAHLEDELGEDVSVREFEPAMGFRARIGAGASAVAYAFGAGVARAVTGGGDGERFQFR